MQYKKQNNEKTPANAGIFSIPGPTKNEIFCGWVPGPAKLQNFVGIITPANAGVFL